jgi:hypothetical protein
VTIIEELLGEVFSVWFVPRCYKQDKSIFKLVVRESPASSGIGVVREHQLQKENQPLPLSKEEQRKKKKNKSLDTEQIYGHG